MKLLPSRWWRVAAQRKELSYESYRRMDGWRVSTALPCRISIYEEGGKTILATLKPTTLLAMFNTPQLKGVAQEVEDTNVKIMKEAVAG
jgi:hypothetical protein